MPETLQHRRLVFIVDEPSAASYSVQLLSLALSMFPG